MFFFISSYVSLSLFWFPQKIDAQAIEEFYGLTSDISKNSESGYILFYQSRDWAGRSDWQDGRVWFVRDRIRLIGRLGLFWHSSAPLSQVPFHPGLSVELCTGASIRPQAGAVDARVTQAQKQSPSGSPSSHSPALCCSAHTKNAHIHIWNELHIRLDGLRIDTVQTFFSPPHTVTSLISIIWFTSHSLGGVMIYDLAQCPDQSRNDWRFFTLRCSSAVSNICVNQPVINVLYAESSCCHCSRAAPPEW